MLFAVVLLLAMADSPLRLGIQALERRDFAVAVQQLEQASKSTPGDPNIWVLLAQARFGIGKKDAAIAAAVKAEEAGKGNADVLHGLAFLYAEFAHDYAKAAAFEARYAQAQPKDTAAWGRVATLYLQAEMPEQAIEPALAMFRANQTAEARSLLEDAYFRASQSQLLKKDFDGAVATLETARATLKDSAQVELALGVALYGQRKFAQAVGQFIRTMELAPDVEQPYLFVGKILEHAGDRLPTLLERFEVYRQRNPESYLGYLLTAKAMIAQGADADQALIMAKQAIEKKEDEPEAHFIAGTILESRGDFAEAATSLERSAALRSSDPTTHYRLARVYLKLGRKEDAARERAVYEKLTDDAGNTTR